MPEILPSRSAPRPLAPGPTTSTDHAIGGAFVDAFDGRYYRIAHAGRLPVFFMNIVSASDLWLFLASNGALTAGRNDADHALFPYVAVDRLYDTAGASGPFTALWVERDGPPTLWHPFLPPLIAGQSLARHLYKSVEGDRVWFEEIHAALGLGFRSGWATADTHGFVRRCELHNLSDRPVTFRLWDSLRNLQPPGIPRPVQERASVLADAYKTAELLTPTRLAVYALAAGIVDRPIPLETLRASTVWSEGLPGATVLVSDRQLPAFLDGRTPRPEKRARGIRASYALHAEITLPPGAIERWSMVADFGVTHSTIISRRHALVHDDPAPQVRSEIAAGTRRLRAIVGAADGLECRGNETSAAHHFANVLFNLMRGGVFVAGHEIPGADFARHIRLHDTALAGREAAFLDALPARQSRADLLERVAARGDAALTRLASEYLPLTFSRRHGDPSRPWNRFHLHGRDAQGARVVAYEGNWRDIFQNWEALGLSHPEFIEAVVARFLNASTADGYNPYRLSHAGIDWEVPEPGDPWASIGYWGDHQVVYLLRLLEWSARFHPGRLRSALRQPGYSYANIPYRIAPYAALRRDPHHTIAFDAALHRATTDRAARAGADARLLTAPGGAVLHASLAEKLLVLVLGRLTNFVPGGGIWMNTQRPEWNDANNALVGYGVSVVTLCHLRRLLHHAQRHLWPALGHGEIAIASPIARLAREVQAAFAQHRAALAHPAFTDVTRRTLLDALATAGSSYREDIYRTPARLAAAEPVAPVTLVALFDLALAFIDHSLRANLRADGLFHTYHQLEFAEEPAALRLHPLQLMLEGQVAVLGSDLLTPAEAVKLLSALRRSVLYRPDQHSYLLYPDRVLPGFLERNRVPAGAVADCPLLAQMHVTGDPRLIVRDAEGAYRFAPDLVNAAALDAQLAALAAEPRWAAVVAADALRVRALYETVFRHRAFTGRSGSMFGYEGLGCTYWHMVAKLLVAVQENLVAAEAVGARETAALADHYYDIRAGLGFNKSPALYGAFPTDPYSHTPGHAGAQQPGMTGQVKEEILTRLGELGVQIADGKLAFRPSFLRAEEFTTAPAVFRFTRPDGSEATRVVPSGALGFTVCGTPIVYRLTPADPCIRIHDARGRLRLLPGSILDAASSAAVFARQGEIALLQVELGASFRPRP